MTINKDDLRVSARRLRDQLKISQPDAGRVLAERFPEKLYDRFGPVVSGYLAIGSEIDPGPLLDRLRKSGADICLPRVEPSDDMTFRQIRGQSDLEAGPFGLTQPAAHTAVVHPTLVLAPLLAFDAAGNRLGYGKGHYDRALARLRAQGRVFVCGLAYSDQEVISIPVEPTDIPLDWVVTPDRSIPLFMSRMSGKKN
jgi:5-formyltetrahydrofolate cyclo-ligase